MPHIESSDESETIDHAIMPATGGFDSWGLPEVLLQALEAMAFQKPTPIQAQTIPLALQGRDILGSAQTGTGKTAAYGIPLASYLINTDGDALILTPTRELAMQVLTTLKQILGGRKSPIRASLLIGGESIFRQLTQLRTGPRLIVGTPGRVIDHLSRGTLKLHKAAFVVFDETDRMLDMGFTAQLQEIVRHLPQKRQTLMFSATMAQNIVKVAQSYLSNPERISVGSTTTPIAKIKQEQIRTSESEKYNVLVEQLERLDGSCIVFMKTKWSADKLAARLAEQGYGADAIHGDLRQRERERVIRAFREKQIRILVATDVAARGLDIPHIECVVNYDLPVCPEDYIHRIGRTGRAGAEGTAINLITSQDGVRWRNICRMMDPQDKSAYQDFGGSGSGGRGRSAPRSGGYGQRSHSEGGRPFRFEDKFKKFGPRSEQGTPRSAEGGGRSFKFGEKPRSRTEFKPEGRRTEGERARPAGRAGAGGGRPFAFRDKSRARSRPAGGSRPEFRQSDR